MYEKNGLMVKITNPRAIEYIRRNRTHSTLAVVENSLRRHIGIPQKVYAGTAKRVKDPQNPNAFPVKISDQELIDYLCMLKHRYGILQRVAVENAVLENMELEEAAHA